jgi:hypothetical protein
MQYKGAHHRPYTNQHYNIDMYHSHHGIGVNLHSNFASINGN